MIVIMIIMIMIMTTIDMLMILLLHPSILLASLNSTWALLNFFVLATMSVKHWPVVFLSLLDDNIFNVIALMNMIAGKYCCVPVVA